MKSGRWSLNENVRVNLMLRLTVRIYDFEWKILRSVNGKISLFNEWHPLTKFCMSFQLEKFDGVLMVYFDNYQERHTKKKTTTE